MALVRNTNSLGIERYSAGLARGLEAAGCHVVDEAARADVVHFQYGNSSRLLSHLGRGRWRGRVVTLHDLLPRNAALRWMVGIRLARAWSRRASETIVHSNFAAALLDRPCTVIPHWTVARPRPSSRGGGEIVWGLFGRQAPHKGIEFVRKAFEGGAPRRRVLVVGPGAQRTAERLSAAGVAVEAVVPTSRAQYEAELDRVDVLVSVRTDTVGESSGPVLEALGRGIPVAFTPVGATPEIVSDAGFLVETPADLRRLADGVAEGGRLADATSRARRRAEGFDLANVVRRHLDIYSRALSPRG